MNFTLYHIPALHDEHVIAVTPSGDVLMAFPIPDLWGGEPVRLDALPPGAELMERVDELHLGEPIEDVTWADVLARLGGTS